MSTNCVATDIPVINAGDAAQVISITPNPFKSFTSITLNDASNINGYELNVFNVLGRVVISTQVTNSITTLNTSELQSGIYFYKVTDSGKLIQTGKLISQQSKS